MKPTYTGEPNSGPNTPFVAFGRLCESCGDNTSSRKHFRNRHMREELARVTARTPRCQNMPSEDPRQVVIMDLCWVPSPAQALRVTVASQKSWKVADNEQN
jgi:hypothetical protein